MSPVLIHYALMAMVLATTVVAFDSVGAILVVAMLVVPAATAYLLIERLPVMLGLAVAGGAASAVAGYGLARTIDGSIAGAMATVSGVLFLLALADRGTASSLASSVRNGCVAVLLKGCSSRTSKGGTAARACGNGSCGMRGPPPA